MRSTIVSIVVLSSCILLLINISIACTGVFVFEQQQAFFGNNEDYNDPNTFIWTRVNDGSYDRIYLGYENLWPQGGMNERGLCFDGFATLPYPLTPQPSLPYLYGDYVDDMLQQFSTVEEVAEYMLSHNRTAMENYQLFFADSTGSSLIVEGDSIVWISGNYQVCTNFYQTAPERGSWPCWRYTTATRMLDRMGLLYPEYVRDIIDSCHVENTYPTQYSNIFDLHNKNVRLYYYHDYSRFVYLTFDQALEELENPMRISDLIVLMGIDEIPEIIDNFEILNAYPNPFNSYLNIEVFLRKAGQTELQIYDINGREVQTIFSSFLNPGRKNVYWNAEGISSGTYFLNLKSGSRTKNKKIVLIK